MHMLTLYQPMTSSRTAGHSHPHTRGSSAWAESRSCALICVLKRFSLLWLGSFSQVWQVLDSLLYGDVTRMARVNSDVRVWQ